jgi:hypothetical protein
MAITFTNGDPKKAPMNPAQKKPDDPQQEMKNRERKRLQDQQKKIQQRLDILKASIARPIRDLVGIMAADDPNDNPNDLFSQIRPLLSKMGLANKADPSKTELVPGKTQGKNSLYKIVLRRNAQLKENEVDRIKREEKALESIQWSAESIDVYLWYPYKAPEVATPPGTPGTPI